jgi:hypothetical protein
MPALSVFGGVNEIGGNPPLKSFGLGVSWFTVYPQLERVSLA